MGHPKKKGCRQCSYFHKTPVMSMKKILTAILLVLPKTYISHFIGFLCDIKWPKFILYAAIKTFADVYKVDMKESKKKIDDFRTFNEFFTREVKKRKINGSKNAVVSPVDGKILSYGKIRYDTLIQAKGMEYSLFNLVKDEKIAEKFVDGAYITFYLAPKNYHRIHSPFDLEVEKSIRIPGTLFPVNSFSLGNISNVLPRNERLITIGNSRIGKIAIVKIGATNVGRIKTSYSGKKIRKGQEVGYFEMGSAVVLLFERNRVKFSKMKKEVKFGEKVASIQQ